ncbi:carbohydrate-binding domain-containing protein [Candidatus Saccharibacteria bacterium]|nr:carbohydrate-binding domain-containing protein [Candidatus Saccharibacteria bacterium]
MANNKTDGKLIALGAITAVVLAATSIINTIHEKASSDKIENNISTDNGDLKINWDKHSTYEINLEDTFTIGQSGTYHLTGSIKDGSIIVNAGNGVVRLILDNVSIKNSSGPAIACYNADDLVIELVGNNTLEDGSTYSKDLDEDVKGAVYSKADLTLTGDGSLSVVANYQDGIVSKDDLKINGGKYIISAKDDGIRGKDSVYIVDGNIEVEAGSDGIKSTNETTAGKGFVLIEKGRISVNAGAKGIKAINSVLINDGNISISSKDDSLHSNKYVGVIGGNIEINSGDDGIHADKELIVDGGNITIKKSYEGLEAQVITINGGNTSIIASDDGINAGGGADNSANNRPGAGMFDADTNCMLTINDGAVYINASGDGLDSNGFLTFNGGTVTVDGPTNNGNGALDSGAGISINGGQVIAVGASGMAESLGASSTIYNASIYFTSAQKAGTKVVIKDSSGKTIISHESAKAFNHMSVGTEEFRKGEKYSIYVNGALYKTFAISDIVTTVGSNNVNQNQSGPGMMRR